MQCQETSFSGTMPVMESKPKTFSDSYLQLLAHYVLTRTGGEVLIMLVFHHVQDVTILLVLKDLKTVIQVKTIFIELKERNVAREHLAMKIEIHIV